MAAALIAILTPILSKYIIMPLFRRFIETRIARFRHYSNLFIMVFVLCAFISIAYYAGTSVLFGAYLAGIFLTALPSSSGPFCVASREEGETAEGKTPAFTHTFEAYIHHPLKYVLEPLFFASIGFAIPFLDLWNGKAIWRGVLYTLLMLLGKVSVWIDQSVQADAGSGAGWRLGAALAYSGGDQQRQERFQGSLGPCCFATWISNGCKRRDWLAHHSSWLFGHGLPVRGRLHHRYRESSTSIASVVDSILLISDSGHLC